LLVPVGGCIDFFGYYFRFLRYVDSAVTMMV